MSTFNIKQIQDSQALIVDKNGLAIPRIEAKVVALYDRKTGKSQHGEWSLQSGFIEDSTGKMKVLFKQLPPQDKLVGRTLIFKSMEGKHGLKGVSVKKNEYQGKTTLELNVTEVALIIAAGEEDGVSLVEPSTRMPQNDPVEAPEAPIRNEDRKLGIAMAKNRLTQLAGLYDLCWKTVEGMDLHSKAIEESEILDIELHKDIATTLFIAAQREGLTDKMPVRTTEKFYGEGVQESPKHESQKEHEDENIPF